MPGICADWVGLGLRCNRCEVQTIYRVRSKLMVQGNSKGAVERKSCCVRGKPTTHPNRSERILA